jgi:PKD domain
VAQAPAVAAAPSATAAGKSARLSVLGASEGGEANLTYIREAGAPVGWPVTFSKNATNLAKRTTATFVRSGTYTVEVTVRDRAGRRAEAAVVLVIN